MIVLFVLLFTSIPVEAAAQTASTCAKIYPIYVDIHNRTVHGATDRFQYGSFIGVGVPYQNQSLWPSLRKNETTFAAVDYCQTSNLTDCINNTGGTINYTASTTWAEDANFRSRDTAEDFTAVGGTDDVHLWTHYLDPSPASGTNITGMPVQYALSGDSPPGIAGLGSSSTMMQSLVDQRLIGANIISLYIGNGMERAGGHFNGSLTFGGYDSGRFQGPVHTYDMDLTQADYLPVTVTDIIIDDPSEPQLRNKSVLHNKESFEARITTDQYPMLFPAAVTQNLINLLGGSSSGSSDDSLKFPSSFRGTMTIQLSDGFEIILPADTMATTDGVAPFQHNTNESYTGPFYLSTAWLSQVYLTMDYDSRKFHLAQVLQNGKYVMPKVLCARETPVPYDYSKKMSTWLKYGLTGALVGGLIGSLAFITLATALFLWWYRNRKSRNHQTRWEEDAIWKTRDSVSTLDDEGIDMQELTLVKMEDGRRMVKPRRADF